MREQWVSVIDCFFCKNQIPTRESQTIVIESKYFGVIGNTHIKICKECHREYQLDKLFKSEKQE